MASSVATHTISEYDIHATIESEDGRLNASSLGKGVASINLTVDRGAAGVFSAMQLNPLVICFPAQVPDGLVGTKKYIDMAQPVQVVGQVSKVSQFAITIDKVPGYPIDLTTQLFDINALDEDGNLLVATVHDDATLVGDIDIGASKYDAETGACTITFLKPLKPGQSITFTKRFTNPPRDPLTVNIPDLVPMESIRQYAFGLKTFDVRANKHCPVAPSTVTITALSVDGTTVKVTDNGEGKLIGDIDPTGANTIDYITGAVDVTFSRYLKDGSAIKAEYASYVEVTEFRSGSEVPVRVKITLDWEDLARIVKSVEQAAGAAENGLKYRANT